MTLNNYVGDIIASRAVLDHSSEDYILEGTELLIGFSGHYSLAEIEYKLCLMKEANTLFKTSHRYKLLSK